MNRRSEQAHSRPDRSRSRRRRPTVESMEGRVLLATIRVTGTGDAVAPGDGQVSLREAIQSINAGANINEDVVAEGVFGQDDRILFAPLGGPIQVTSALDPLTRPVTVDGGNAVTISGSQLPRDSTDGLVLTGGGSTALGLTIREFPGAGLVLQFGGNNTIGGESLGQGNLLAANDGGGLRIESGSNGNLVIGNTIGASNQAGIADGNGGPGISIVESARNQIGGTAAGAGDQAQTGTFNAEDLQPPKRIPPVGTGGSGDAAQDVTVSRIEVAGLAGQVNDVNVTLSLTHSFVGDLVISLVSPTGVEVLLVDGRGGGGSNFTNTTFDDQAATPISLGDAPFTGSFRPETPLTAFNGLAPNGTWELRVRDRFALDIGELDRVSLEISAVQDQGGQGNLISGNAGSGVVIVGTQSVGNSVLGNIIGADINRSTALPNGRNGVEVTDAPGTVIGGSTTSIPGGTVVRRATDLPKPIPPDGSGGSGDDALDVTTSRIEVAGLAGQITDLNVGLSLTHSFVGDLVISLRAPDGTTVLLSNGRGGGGQDYLGTTFDDQAATPISAGIPPFSGSFRPEQPLSVLNGIDPNGTWELQVRDQFFFDIGLLEDFNLTFTTTGVQAATGSGNLISGNRGSGISLQGPETVDAMIMGNLIGVNGTGERALANQEHGVFIGGVSGAVVGGSSDENRNLISGNAFSGVRIQGGARNVAVTGNRIGTNLAGTAAIPNAFSGVAIGGGSSGITVGGTAAGAGNLISGNTGDGITIEIGSFSNLVLGNTIGLDGSDSSSISNNFGISVFGASNTIGGTAPGATNIVTGNRDSNILISGPMASGNQLLGNRIGLNRANSSVRVGRDGVRVENAPGNAIGGVNEFGPDGSIVAQAGNIIAGNLGNGIAVVSSIGTSVRGNFIGIAPGADLDGGDLDRGNGQNGILIDNEFLQILQDLLFEEGFRFLGGETGLAHTVIGGDETGSRNVISSNRGNGIELRIASRTLIRGNYLGSNTTGEVAGRTRTGTADFGNVGNGILVTGRDDRSGSSFNLIGGTEASSRNVIMASGGSGIAFSTFAGQNLVQGNFIGTTADGLSATFMAIDPTRPTLGELARPLGNLQDGITISSESVANTIGGEVAGAGNLISGNQKNGISLLVNSHLTVIQGNRIGTNRDGNAALPNNLSGIFVQSLANVIGVRFPTEGGEVDPSGGNLISGNGLLGLVISLPVDEPPGMFSFVYGNRIGTDASGTFRVPNAQGGILINDSPVNFIGDPRPGLGNLISGNDGAGVQIVGERAINNLVQGNLIGTDVTGTSPLGNAGNGIFINRSNSNLIGDASPGAGNLISGNDANGIEILSATGNQVLGNSIGTDAAGVAPLGNALNGVFLNLASRNTIGLGVFGGGNLISGNGAFGVFIAGAAGVAASGNVIQGNLIGTDRAGQRSTSQGGGEPAVLPLGNNLDGINLTNASDNTIGGAVPGEGNLISGNLQEGIELLERLTIRNLIAGNLIGTDATGSVAIGNGTNGIRVAFGASDNPIGGLDASLRNVISGNLASGIELFFRDTTGTVIQGNFIGTNADGTAPLGNAFGIFVNDAVGNTIGGPNPGNFGDPSAGIGGGNLISGNVSAGIQVFRVSNDPIRPGPEDAPVGVVIQGNFIGTDITGGRALGNGTGVLINNSPNNSIGGATPEIRNVISGNAGLGVQIIGSRGFENRVVGNYIGSDPTGTRVVRGPNGFSQGVGVLIADAGADLAQMFEGNLVIDNRIVGNQVGLQVAGPAARGNQAFGNTIGAVGAGNTVGVFINGAPRNLIGAGGFMVDPDAPQQVRPIAGVDGGGNLIQGNTSIGVAIVGRTAVRNLVNGNSIFDHTLGNDDPRSTRAAIGVFIQQATDNAIRGSASTPQSISRNDIGVFIFDQADENFVEGNDIRDNTRYGIFLLNAAGNVQEADQNANRISSNQRRTYISDFREFTNPAFGRAPQQTETETGTAQAVPRGPAGMIRGARSARAQRTPPPDAPSLGL